MSRGWAGGSTRAWRKLRLYVLARDRWRCQLLEDDGQPCGRQLYQGHLDPRHRATVEHLDPLAEGHPLLADPSRLVAACATHNGRGGAAMTNATRKAEPPRSWSWG
jgi:5-methylcytosine-specific restriction endonuclease McrA